MICFILKIRMSSCSLQSVTWQLLKLIQTVYTSRVILEATINRYPMLQLVGLIQLTQILQMFAKAISDEPTERTNWLSSQQNLNVNEDVFGTQVEQQLQDGTVCALCVSCCKLYFSTIAELPVQYSSRPATHCPEAGVALVYAQICRNCSF